MKPLMGSHKSLAGSNIYLLFPTPENKQISMQNVPNTKPNLNRPGTAGTKTEHKPNRAYSKY
jgi:hypothetical protein